jgi:hypothetical protein
VRKPVTDKEGHVIDNVETGCKDRKQMELAQIQGQWWASVSAVLNLLVLLSMLVIILPADMYGHEICSNMEEETHIQDV